ncbi:MAG: sulfite exporter TauE/SafE family protein [Pseudomonadota bacterium]
MTELEALVWTEILLFVVIGFVAQLVDGALGMAYKVTTSSVLLSFGLPPATVSGSVHAAGTFTSVASGLAHWRVGNIDRRLMLRLLVPGMIGGAIGGLVLVGVSGTVLRPWISAYLMLIGGYILWKALRVRITTSGARSAAAVPLGFFGGLLDAIGGGGWGPIVTTTLVGHGVAPRTAIGSVNAAEFFVTVTIAGTLLVTVGISPWPIIAALVVGGVVAAPVAALNTRYLPERVLMVALATVILLLSGRTLLLALS